MIRFEEAKKRFQWKCRSWLHFCIAAYLERSKIKSFTDKELKEFMEDISEDIMEWLMEERK